MRLLLCFLVTLFGAHAFSEEIMMRPSISESNGINTLSDKDLYIYSVGISTGGLAEIRMATLHPDRKIIGTTIDAEGAQFAQKQIEERGLSQQVIVKIEDVSQPLPYKDKTFDFIYARLVLHYLPREKLTHALNELHRVLKDRGEFFVVVRSLACDEAHSKNSTYDPVTGLTTYTSDEGRSYKRYFHTEDSIQEYLKAAGFLIQQIRSYEEQLCVDFQRMQPSKHIDTLIEVLASRS